MAVLAIAGRRLLLWFSGIVRYIKGSLGAHRSTLESRYYSRTSGGTMQSLHGLFGLPAALLGLGVLALALGEVGWAGTVASTGCTS